jgi:hypothetical protein
MGTVRRSSTMKLLAARVPDRSVTGARMKGVLVLVLVLRGEYAA